MKSGPLRDRITLQSQAAEQDETGQMLSAWTDVAMIWGEIKYVTGMSAIKAGMDTSSVKASIRIRYMAGVNAGMRVLHDGDIFTIEAVIPNKHSRTIDLIVKVKNAQT